MQKVKLFVLAFVVALLLPMRPVQAQSQSGILVALTTPGAEVLVGCGGFMIGGLANAQGVFTHAFPIGPNCVNSLGKQKAVTFFPDKVTTVIFGNDIFLPLMLSQ